MTGNWTPDITLRSEQLVGIGQISLVKRFCLLHPLFKQQRLQQHTRGGASWSMLAKERAAHLWQLYTRLSFDHKHGQTALCELRGHTWVRAHTDTHTSAHTCTHTLFYCTIDQLFILIKRSSSFSVVIDRVKSGKCNLDGQQRWPQPNTADKHHCDTSQ